MKTLKKLTCIICTIFLSVTLLSSPIVTNAAVLPGTEDLELRQAILNGTYSEYCLQKSLHEGDEVISEQTTYLRINESNPSAKAEVVSENEFLNEIPGPSISTIGFKPGEDINLPDKYNWIQLSIYCIKLEEPIHNNNYQFCATYRWKRNPMVIAFKDVFGIASDGNFVFDTSTFSGQAINPTTFNPYGEVVDFTNASEDIVENTSGVAFKNKLSGSRFPKIYPMGSINVLGNAAASSAGIGITYAHSQLTGSFDVSIDKDGPAISVSPSVSFDTITQTASIDF